MTTIQPEGNYYNKYESKNPIERRLIQGYFSAMDAMLAAVKPVKSVFDAGCGEGLVTRHIQTLLQPESMLASDISQRLIQANQAAFQSSGIQFFSGSIYDIALPDHSAELVCACEVIEHLEEPGRAIGELFRVSGRFVFLSVPNEPVWRIANVLRGKYVRALGNTPGHLQHFCMNALRNQVEAFAGCEAVCLAKRAPFPWIQLLYEKVN